VKAGCQPFHLYEHRKPEDGAESIPDMVILCYNNRMDFLWSPWRMDYIQSQKSSECVFCEAAKLEDGPPNLIIYRAQYCFLILNRYPYTSGHLMVVPYEHVALLEELEPQARAEMMEMSAKGVQALKHEYLPHGFNIGINIGIAGGAGIEKHIHLHVVPRWQGDSNFMVSISGTRVLPEALEDSYWRIKKAWQCFVDK
jgi:ATP adenylyltransferase